MTFPEQSYPKIPYSFGVVTENGQGFASALQEPASIEAAKRRGFTERQ